MSINMYNLFKKASEQQVLDELRKTQDLIKEKKDLVNKLRCPTCNGLYTDDMYEFASNFVRLTNGMMSPEEFAFRCVSNNRYDTELLFSYLHKLGNYLVIFSDYESKATLILREIKELEQVEFELKKKLKIY